MKVWVFAVLAACMLAGCRSPSRLADLGPRYKPENVHAAAKLPPHLARVALLPLACTGDGSAAVDSADALADTLETELRGPRAFEVIRISPAQLRQWTGKPCWRASEMLPMNFFSRLREQTGCDAVVFASLNSYRPYPPLAIGWDLKLVDCKDQQIWWAVDEVLDAGAAPVARLAKDYADARPSATMVLQSPRAFSQFAASTIIATLPPR